jgi:hypothetical protein
MDLVLPAARGTRFAKPDVVVEGASGAAGVLAVRVGIRGGVGALAGAAGAGAAAAPGRGASGGRVSSF